MRRVLGEHVEYYNATRPHLTLQLETPHSLREMRRSGEVLGHALLGGLHHRYEREAA